MMRIRTVSGLPSPVRTRPTDGGDRTKANVVALNNRTGPRQPIAGKLPSVLNGRRPEPLSNDLSFDGVGSLHRRLGTDSHIHVRLATSQTKWPRGTTGCDAGRLPSDLRGVKLEVREPTSGEFAADPSPRGENGCRQPIRHTRDAIRSRAKEQPQKRRHSAERASPGTTRQRECPDRSHHPTG